MSIDFSVTAVFNHVFGLLLMEPLTQNTSTSRLFGQDKLSVNLGIPSAVLSSV